jgi:hypothetical protein
MTANNSLLTRAFRSGKVNWQLWRKLISRKLYCLAIRRMGIDIIAWRLPRMSDILHMAFIFFFTSHFVRVNYYGYVYYWKIPGCASLIKGKAWEWSAIRPVIQKLYNTNVVML